MTATLWLIPVPLGAEAFIEAFMPATQLADIRGLHHFVVETPKVARAFLKPIIDGALADRQWYTLDQQTDDREINGMLAALLNGESVGLLSDAGCPGIADPGAKLVAKVHEAIAEGANIRIRPLIGPSSITLSLMASGMNGQHFSFVGYLPAKPEARKTALLQSQSQSQKNKQTILFIETPYRSQVMLQSALDCLAPSTKLLSASQLTLPEERITCRTVAQWRKLSPDAINLLQPSAPTVFAIEAN